MSTIRISALVALLASQGCSGSSPGQQCLDSFKTDLKDPESGKVISFQEPELVYTATNSYGARIQGKALCVKDGVKWRRDHNQEYSKVLQKSTETINASTACMKSGKSMDECAGDSLAMKHRRPGGEIDIDALNIESKDALGF